MDLKKEGKYKYNPWPLGKIPEEFQRSELKQLKELGYKFNDPREVVDIWERKVAAFAGSKYAVSTDCCSHAIFLCLKYINKPRTIDIPKNTYISIPMQIVHAGYSVYYNNIEWEGIYNLYPLNIYDAAVRWTENMYIPNSLMCLSFQIKKRIPIGRGGMILTDDENAYRMLKLMSYDGRDLTTPYDNKDHVQTIGYHYYQTPEDCARGIILMDNTPLINDDSACWKNYPDVSKFNLK